MKLLVFLVLWVVLGCIGFCIMAVIDMRGEEYNKDIFKEKGYDLFGLIICMGTGGLAFIISVIELKTYNTEFNFTRLLYKIANIGLNKKEKDGE